MRNHSDDLLTLIHECLQFDPALRPTPQDLVKKIEPLMPGHFDGMNRSGTETWSKKKEEELILFNFRKGHSTRSVYQLDANRIGKSYRKENPRKFQDAKKKWRRIVAKQTRDGKKGSEWNTSAPLSP
jgi:hypothetical protein